MTRILRVSIMLLMAFGISGCGQAAETTPPADDSHKVEQPAVAGLFYPRQKEALSAKLDKLLAAAEPVPLGKLRGLICPHAGYEYSGPTAAIGYKQVAGRKFDTVFVLGPSHCADFQGAAVLDAAAYATPLDKIPLSPRAAELAKLPPFSAAPSAKVDRPQWWQESGKQPPPAGEETPHTWEHSVEVQLPFLQKVLSEFRLVPVVVGKVDTAQAAEALARFADDKTLFVASSDLSHFQRYEEARQLDTSCVQAICDLDVPRMEEEDACGKLPILTLMHLAKQRGWKAKLLDYRNSGDTAGDRRSVVGYAAIAFYEDAPAATGEKPAEDKWTEKEQQLVLDLARQTLTNAVNRQPKRDVDAAQVPERLRKPGGCFVTLTKEGRLRGCIGDIFPSRALYQSVMDNAISAALRDPRFSPVQPDEVDGLRIEVSVLTVPAPLELKSPDDLLTKLRPGIDGVVFTLRGRRSTYLPQVWEQVPDKNRFLNELAKKAGLAPEAWKDPEAVVLTYQVHAFHEAVK